MAKTSAATASETPAAVTVVAPVAATISFKKRAKAAAAGQKRKKHYVLLDEDAVRAMLVLCERWGLGLSEAGNRAIIEAAKR